MTSLTPRDRRLPVTPVVLVSAQDAAGFSFVERTHAIDVSGTGLCFESAHHVPAGTRVTLKVLIPGAWRARFSGRPVYPVWGVVRRCERCGNEGRFRIAIRFLGDERSKEGGRQALP